MPPNDSRYLAYIASEGGVPLLHLYLLEALRDRTPPSVFGAQDPVTDFAFSPDGRWLAYRIDLGGAHALALLDVENWVATAIPLEAPSGADGAATYYSWSLDSSTLAVAFTAGDEGDYLGGVTVSGSDLVSLAPVAASVLSRPVWIEGHVGYWGPPFFENPPQDIYVAALGSQGFSEPSGLWSYELEAVIQAGPAGFYAIDPVVQEVDFFPIPLDPGPILHWEDVVAPSGACTAHASAEARLEVSEARDFAPTASAPGCSQLLAWAPERERIACVNGTTEVRFFDYSPGNELVGTIASPASAVYDYSATTGAGRRRALSRTGHWLGLSTDTYLYIGDLAATPPSIYAQFTPQLTPPTVDLFFSPDERWLVEWRGPALLLRELAGASEGVLPVPLNDHVLDPMPPPSECSESFVLEPLRWCGAAQGSSAFSWSPGSVFVAFATAGGSLDLAGPGLPTTTLVSCGNGCIRQFGFQPAP